jgi:hypothetical protein
MTSANGNDQARWAHVSASRPCPRCGKSDWCRVSACGAWCICRRNAEGGREKTDKSGAGYWLHKLIASQSTAGWPEPRFSHAGGQGRKAEADDLHRIYTEFLRGLSLIPRHQTDLDNRGFSTEKESAAAAVRRLQYRTLPGPGRAAVVQKLIQQGLEDQLPTVPGFFVQDKDGRRYWTVSGGAGLLIPVRDEKRRIVALLVRPDDAKPGKKYLYLSSKRRGGPGPGAPVHVPLFDGTASIVRVTEGALKADLATLLSGVLTIGLPGVSSWRLTAKVLRRLKAATARIAFDADARTNRFVAEALSRLASDLRKAGFAVELERWNLADGKGVDDLLAAGKAPEVLAGDAAATAIDEIIRAAHLADPPPATAAKALVEAGASNEAVDDPHRLARLWLAACAAHPDRFRLLYYREEFWRWNGKCWTPLPDAEMRSRLARYTKRQLDDDNRKIVAHWTSEAPPPKVPKVTRELVSNIIQALSGEVLMPRDGPQTGWLEGDRVVPRNYVALDNGVLDADAVLAGQHRVLQPHTPRWWSPVSLPYPFRANAQCPRWEAFLQRNLEGDAGKASLLQQLTVRSC